MRWIAASIGALLLSALPGLTSAEEIVSPPPALASAAHPAAAARAKERAWWNHDAVIADLVLTAEQRVKMDELLYASLQQEGESRRKQHEANAKLEDALHHGDLKAAREAAPGLREALGDSWECKSMLMLDVLSVLDGEQRQKLLASHPDLLRQPWEDDRPTRARAGRRVLPPRAIPAR